MRPLGKKQLDLLAMLGRPYVALVIGDKITRSLTARGLLRPLGDNSFFCITPAGLRVLAGALEAGLVAQPLPRKADIARAAEGRPS